MIHFLGCWHADPFWGENTSALLARLQFQENSSPGLVGLEYSEVTHTDLLTGRPVLLQELRRILPGADPRLIDSAASSLGWEPTFARGKWPGANLAWLDDSALEGGATSFAKRQAEILGRDLSQAGAASEVRFESARQRLLEFAREKSRRVAAKDPAVIGYGPVFDWDGRDTRMFRALQAALNAFPMPPETVLLIGLQHLIAGERTVLQYCRDAGYPVAAHWLHELS